MELTLGWISAIVGVVGSLITGFFACLPTKCSFKNSQPTTKTPETVGAVMLLVVTLVFWIISMQSRPPFSSGQSLGIGFLIGGLVSIFILLVNRWTGFWNVPDSNRTKGMAILSTVFLAIAVPSIVYLVFSGYPQNALIGTAIGCCMGGIVARLICPEGFDTVLMDIFTITLVLICGGIILGLLHFYQDFNRMWWILPALVAVSGCVAAYVGIEVASAALTNAKSGMKFFVSSLIAAVIVLGICALFSAKLTQQWALMKVAVMSIVAWWLIGWQCRMGLDAERKLETITITYVLLLGFLIVAFKLWSGLGIAIGISTGLAVIIPALTFNDDDSVKVMFWTLFTALAAVLFRLFIEYYRADVGRGDVRIHYTLIGAVASAVVAMLLVTMWSRSERAACSSSERKTAVCKALFIGKIGLFSSLFPLVLMLIWDIKAVLGLMFGTIFAFVMLGFGHQCAGSDSISDKIRKIPLLLIGMQLVVLQFINPMLIIDMTRATRIWILMAGFALAAIWIVMLDMLSSKKEIGDAQKISSSL